MKPGNTIDYGQEENSRVFVSEPCLCGVAQCCEALPLFEVL